MALITSLPVFYLGCVIPVPMWKGHHSSSVLGLAPKHWDLVLVGDKNLSVGVGGPFGD